MKAIITGGGTGGHIYPALAIARKLKDKKWDVLYIGSQNSQEEKIVPEKGFKLETVAAAPLPRKITPLLARTIILSAKGFFQARKLIKRFNPDIVFGTGGFVAGPIVLAAVLSGYKTIIHEQNVYPGITNRLLSLAVDRIALNFEEAIAYFPVKKNNKFVVTGNPIRESILTTKRRDGIEKLQLDHHRKTLLVFGGSQGSQTINQAMIDVCKVFAGKSWLQIIYITGTKNYQEVKKKLKKIGFDFANTDNIKIFPYLHNMEFAYAAADLIVYRAGATGLAEITARGIPSILIPYPYAAGDHQQYNAGVLKKEGAAVVISDDKLNAKYLVNCIKKLFNETGLLKKMRDNSKKIGKPEAAAELIKEIEKMVRE